MRERAGGFTEAEILALAWSKRVKEGELIKAKKQTQTPKYPEEHSRDRNSTRREDRRGRQSRKHSRKSPEHAGVSSSRRSPENRRKRRHGERDSPNYSLGSYEKHVDGVNIADRSRSPHRRERNDEWDRSRSRECTVSDENDIHRSRTRDSELDRDNDRSKHRNPTVRGKEENSGGRANNYRARSRSKSWTRSRSRSISHRRDRSRSNSRSKSRSRSRSRSRSPMPPTWSHDMFSSVVTDSPERKAGQRGGDSDYRPPSPTWVSRAGGVAIMRKKS